MLQISERPHDATVHRAVMQFVFRVDASLEIGTGHVMRCLTLAEYLRGRGADCAFVSREHPGNLATFVERRGFKVSKLPACPSGDIPKESSGKRRPAHANWLGADRKTDAAQTRNALSNQTVDWLVVDHYALERDWEVALRPACRNLMVIDDLADRHHDCDVLLDQNLGRHGEDYASLVGKDCTVLAGPEYALLRPEFSAMRNAALMRRKSPVIEQILVNMGGVDQNDATSAVLAALQNCDLPDGCKIIVVMGPHAPWIDRVKAVSSAMPHPVEVFSSVADMARLMADSDIAVGAAGTATWERCCLGLPTLVVVLASNQQLTARSLEKMHAATVIADAGNINTEFPSIFNTFIMPDNLANTIAAASRITDGTGAMKVAKILDSMGENNDGD